MYKVLIVDDDKTSRYILKRYKNWEKYGFCIEGEACDGKEALKILKDNKFDLIITDIKMPGMDGIEFLNELNMLNINVCVSFLSSHCDFEYAKQGIRLGAFDYITKPLDDNLLGEALERIRIHLDKNRREDEQKKLASLLICGNLEVLKESEKFIKDILDSGEKDILKIEMIVNKLLLKLQEEIYLNWPWIKNIQGSIIDEKGVVLESLSDAKAIFVEKINNLLEIISKYKLNQKDSIVRSTCEFVLEHVEADISLEIISNHLHVNKDYIGKLFKQSTGQNFKQYLTTVKMEHAKYLLKSGYYKNYEVSEKLGYSNVDYFCRLFKAYTGYTPVEFRNKA